MCIFHHRCTKTSIYWTHMAIWCILFARNLSSIYLGDLDRSPDIEGLDLSNKYWPLGNRTERSLHTLSCFLIDLSDHVLYLMHVDHTKKMYSKNTLWYNIKMAWEIEGNILEIVPRIFYWFVLLVSYSYYDSGSYSTIVCLFSNLVLKSSY